MFSLNNFNNLAKRGKALSPVVIRGNSPDSSPSCIAWSGIASSAIISLRTYVQQSKRTSRVLPGVPAVKALNICYSR